jgi:acetyl esterase/lipase
VIVLQCIIRVLVLLAGAFAFVTAGATGSVKYGLTDLPSTGQSSEQKSENRLSLGPVLAKNTLLRSNVSYGEDDKHRLDVYYPKEAKKAPVVVFVHGGGWARGDKSAVGSMPKLLSENGIAFVSINYRLTPSATHPAHVNDVAAAVRWVYEHANEFGCDRELIFLMGNSAGCHLVALTALDPRYLDQVKLRPADLRGVVAWGGRAYNLVEEVKAAGPSADDIRLAFGDSEDAWRDASPVAYVKNAQTGPAFYFVSLEAGSRAHQAAEQMAGMIRDANGEAESGILKGQDPFSANHLLDTSGDTTGRLLIDFIRRETMKPIRKLPVYDRSIGGF